MDNQKSNEAQGITSNKFITEIETKSVERYISKKDATRVQMVNQGATSNVEATDTTEIETNAVKHQTINNNATSDIPTDTTDSFEIDKSEKDTTSDTEATDTSISKKDTTSDIESTDTTDFKYSIQPEDKKQKVVN